MYKLFAILSVVSMITGSGLAAPLEARRGRGGNGRGGATAQGAVVQANVGAGNLVQCTSFDQSAAAFSNGEGPDVKLPPCSTITAPKVPFSCTNIQAVANAFGTALCNTIGNAAVASPPKAAAPPPLPAAGKAQAGALVQCTTFDQSAAAFSNPDGPDLKLPQCSSITAPKVPFPCTNIQAVANAFGTKLCSTIGQ